jgi:glycosyltransferase involved in cell wall biosynthesis
LKISIITVCYNSSETIRDTIESVLSQDHGDIEYLIVDGGSTDNTLDIIGEYGDRVDVVVSEPDQGIYDAMNKGIRLASGDFVGTLNSDDLFAGDSALSDLVKFLSANPELDASYADLVYVRRGDIE